MMDEFFICDCDGEAIHVRLTEWDEYTTFIDFSMWYRGTQGHRRSRWDYIKRILKYGHPYSDEVLLLPEQARKLAAHLNLLADKCQT